MALSINLNTDKSPLLAIADKVACKGWGQQLESCGVILEVLPKTLILRRKGAVVSSAVVNSSAIKLLLQGNLQNASKMMLSEKLRGLYESAIKDLLAAGVLTNKIEPNDDLSAANGENHPSPPPDDDEGYEEEEEEDLLPHPGGKISANKAPANLSTSNASVGTLSKAGPVKLSSATEIGQPVNATSAGSIYHTVGLSSGVNAGARLKVNGVNWSLAVRFEGSGLSKAADLLKGIGATPGNNYYSLHLSGDGGAPMALRALGAVLIGSGLSWVKTMAPCQPLINAGV